jgi:hypothetical protein
LGLGTMRLPKIEGEGEKIDFEKAQEIVDYAYSHKINYFDTAFPYHNGESESFIGPALSKYPRESYYLATKMPLWEVKDASDFERIFNIQLQRTSAGYFDFYLMHAMNRDNFKKAVELDLYGFMKKKQSEGLIRFIGFSFHDSPEVLEEIAEKYEWDFAQIQFNYLDYEQQNAKRQYEILEEHSIPAIIMEPVRGGSLASLCEKADEIFKSASPDKSIASWAIRYAASFPNVLTVLSGMSNMEQIKDNVSTMDSFKPIDEKDSLTIAAALDAYKKKDVIPCTGCRYCIDCPMGIPIADIFSAYNTYYAIEQKLDDFKESCNALQGADKCIGCKKCMSHCPQSIKIPEKLSLIVDILSK